MLDSLLVDESKPVTVPIAGDLVPEASGHFVYSLSNTASARRGFVVLQNSDERIEPGNQCKLRFVAISTLIKSYQLSSYLLLLTVINFYQLLSTLINCYQLLSTFINSYQLLSTSINFYQLLSTDKILFSFW